ncbi:hypothetical protein [Antrihabitans spumae]|jgi:hypothetical protein|uniref:Uncharacterized protein n=1 Tax=Antrihabitans spumae TaxID=3373370 RepID=A0ABW7KD52_9NOCA
MGNSQLGVTKTAGMNHALLAARGTALCTAAIDPIVGWSAKQGEAAAMAAAAPHAAAPQAFRLRYAPRASVIRGSIRSPLR